MKRDLNLTDIKAQIAAERNRAVKEARRCSKFWKSRGTFLATTGRGGQCNPFPEADCPYWDGTLKSIYETIALVEAEYPEVEEIYISGGYDGADSLYDYRMMCYEPWVSSWDVSIWTRPVAS